MKTLRFLSALILSTWCLASFVSCEPQVTPDTPKDSFEKKHLLENFTSESCVNCPSGEKQIETYAHAHTDVIQVSHHAGYKDDQWTIADSKKVVYLLGVDQLGTPTVCLDRTKSTYSDPATLTSYEDMAFHPYYLSFLESSEATTYASIVIKNEVDGEHVHVHVSGEVLGKDHEGLRLTVLLKENGLHGKQLDPSYTLAGSWDDYAHAHVARCYLSQMLGDSIQIADGAYTADYTLEWQAGWTKENCMIVAYLTNEKGLDVVQAEEAPVVAGTDGGASHPQGGITPKAVPEGYPEGKYALKDFFKADTVFLEYASAFYSDVNGEVREWHISAFTTQQTYGSGSNKYLPVTDLILFTDANASKAPDSGEWEFTIARTMDDIKIGTAWAGYCDIEAQRIYGSQVILANYEAFQAGQLVPGTNGQWLVGQGSKITFTKDGFLLSGTSAKGHPIVMKFTGEIKY